MKSYIVAFSTLLFVLLSDGAKGQGNSAFNGSFDTDTTGWMLANVFGTGYISDRGNPPGALLLAGPDGSSPATMSQTVTSLTPGLIYLVSGNFRRAGGKNFTDYTLEVAINGISFFRTPPPADFIWQSFSFQYTATASSALLSLSAQLNGDFIYDIDNISMQAVPEPNCLWLLGMGGITGGIYCKNRRKT